MKPKVIITFAILALSAVFIFIFVTPKFEEMGQIRNRLAQEGDETTQIKAKFDTTRLAIRQFQELSKIDKERVDLALPDKVDLPDLFVLIDSLIGDAGLIGEDINISVPSQTEAKPQVFAPAGGPGAIAPRFLAAQEAPREYRDINISFSVVGSYESFKEFLKQLERSLRIFNIQSVSFLAPQASEKIRGAFRFGVSMKTYYNQ